MRISYVNRHNGNLLFIVPWIIVMLKNKRPTWCHLLFYFTFYVRNMFRTLIYPSTGACDCAVELPHRSFCSVRCVLEIWCCSSVRVAGFSLQHGHYSNPVENKTTDVVIQQHSRRLLMMDILMSETCWAHKKWNKIANDIMLVFYSSTRHNGNSIVEGLLL